MNHKPTKPTILIIQFATIILQIQKVHSLQLSKQESGTNLDGAGDDEAIVALRTELNGSMPVAMDYYVFALPQWKAGSVISPVARGAERSLRQKPISV
jgi:hypothetical protein